MDDYQFLSELERKVYNWLTKRKIPFRTQVKMFGIAEIGSATVDFILDERGLAFRCMGEYWHSSLEARARDDFGREQLVNDGYIVIDLWEENLSADRIDRTMEMALKGMEIP